MANVVDENYPKKGPISNEEIKQMFAAEAAAVAGESTPIKHDFATEIIDLPSQGYFYPEGHPLQSGKLEMKYMTAKEEDILSSATLIKQGVVIDRLIQALIVDKINYNDLLVADKNGLLIASRILAYGPQYDVEVTCPNCGTKNNLNIDLYQFESKDLDFSQFKKGQTEFEYKFPNGKVVTYKFLTHGDEKSIEAELKGYNKLRSISGVDTQLSTRLKHIITSVDGNNDQGVINKFVDNLLSRDSLQFRKHLKEVTPDIDLTFPFACSNCDHVDEKMQLPLGVSFFWPGA
jgi:hypothetical protein